MKTLVLVFHPHVEDSHVNRKLMDVAGKVDGVTVVDEYAAYPDFKIDVEREHALLQEHDRIVLQFPFYWYSAPALLKQWEDDVLNIGWAYGDYALEGKEIMVAVSTGAPAECYTHDGSQARTMEELLSPYEPCLVMYTPPIVNRSSCMVRPRPLKSSSMKSLPDIPPS